MDIDAIAKKAREKIFARVEDDRCLHASSVEEEIARAIREAMPTPSWYGGVVAIGTGGASRVEIGTSSSTPVATSGAGEWR